jgi:hypothetical protein
MKPQGIMEVERCTECLHEWVAMFPRGKTSDRVECPVCKKNTGVPK